MASNDEVEAIVSDPNFEIITTFAYSAGLPHNEASLSGSHCYLLQHGIDRLQAAASDLSWTAVAEDLRSIDRLQSLSKEVGTHMLSTHGEASKDPSRRFIVRLALKRDGILSIMSGPRPNSSDPLYPTTLSNIISPLHTSAIPIYLDSEPTTPSLFTKHKTTHRQPYSAAWKRVGMDETTSPAGCDVLLQNENGHIMGAAFRTVYFWRDGRLVTPSSATGCKMGVSRRWAVENAGVRETLIPAIDISDGEVVWLSSAVGGFIQGKVTLERKTQNN
ncbi:aminotransferase class IV-domain-containing protein [Colletotrichum navitas]|uniref:Aminotransferase class IV-domain-containing protein n=1 Tax=Colletotrichum navitas TaxID=681940 RepID=A0AAD8PRY9_9PEZI|nr:aminotransferase class IV-domain-containing protein [Colletotrichum navitas]KAK1579631.1 aminotransferase class IV-domain-containing protein [Colletotrichum navitas]